MLTSAKSSGVSGILVAGIILLGFTGILELTWPQQLVLRALVAHRSPGNLDGPQFELALCSDLTLMFASGYATPFLAMLRVLVVATTAKFFLDPGSTWSWLGFRLLLCKLLLVAEGYAFVILFLGRYMQTIWPPRRTPVPLPDDPAGSGHPLIS